MTNIVEYINEHPNVQETLHPEECIYCGEVKTLLIFNASESNCKECEIMINNYNKSKVQTKKIIK